MTRKKIHQPEADKEATPPVSSTTKSAKSMQENSKWLRMMHRLPYFLSFILLWFFVSITYGDVFTRSVQESFVCSDASSMAFLTGQENGTLYLLGRYALLIFHNVWLGGFIFSLILTAIAVLLDRAFRLPLWLRGVFTIVPFALLYCFVTKGIELYYKNEPSLFIIQTVAILLIALVLAIALPYALRHFCTSKNEQPQGWRRIPVGMLVTLLSFGGMEMYAHSISVENTILTARMQNHILDNDLNPLIEEGFNAQQPTRSVAAYYALGLLHNDQLLEHLFDISFLYPEIDVKQNDGSGEYGIFLSDCCFYSGLINGSYRAAMDQTVMDGPRLYYLKRMALCAILNQEKNLADKYLTIISKVPFEKDFVEQYRPYIDNPELIKQNYAFNHSLNLRPVEQRFEQNYRRPLFLGYYTGILQGSNEALAPSMAACLYAKDLPNLAQRAIQYKNLKKQLPLSVMEGLALFARKHPFIYKYFPELQVNNQGLAHPAVNDINNFFLSIQSLFEEKYHGAPDWRQRMSDDLQNGISKELHDKLAPDWKGHYVFYYYCENVKMKDQSKHSKESSVN